MGTEVKPEEHIKNADERTYKHPSYGQISVSRVSGRKRCYGSDFEHQNYVVVELKHSEEHWSYMRPWYFGKEAIASIAMTEAQWAQFVSSFNVGMGTPCTLEYTRDGALVQHPVITPLRPRADEFKNEHATTFKEALTALREALKAAKDRKVHSSIIAGIEKAIREVGGSAPFAEKQFAEHVEELVEEAKIEANAFLDHAIKTAGLKVLEAPEKVALEDKGRYLGLERE
jgi:hypothetical protein